jgi:hypothetical protein
LEGDLNNIDSHEDDIDREVKQLIQEMETRQHIRPPLAELLLMINSDLDLWHDIP